MIFLSIVRGINSAWHNTAQENKTNKSSITKICLNKQYICNLKAFPLSASSITVYCYSEEFWKEIVGRLT